MEIELPDGTVLDAPDGSDPSVVAKNYLRSRGGAPAPAASGGSRLTPDQQTWVASIRPQAEAAARALGVNPNAIISQAALETGWGTAAPGNNLFGVKPGSQWSGPSTSQTTTEYANGVPSQQTDQFRAYGSPDESVQDYANLIRNRYPGAVAAGNDPRAYAQAIQKGGYATDPLYAQKMISIVDMLEQQPIPIIRDPSVTGYQPAPIVPGISQKEAAGLSFGDVPGAPRSLSSALGQLGNYPEAQGAQPQGMMDPRIAENAGLPSITVSADPMTLDQKIAYDNANAPPPPGTAGAWDAITHTLPGWYYNFAEKAAGIREMWNADESQKQYADYLRAQTIPDAYKRFQRTKMMHAMNGDATFNDDMFSDPKIVEAAQAAGLPVAAFLMDWPKYVNMTPEESFQFQAHALAQSGEDANEEAAAAANRETAINNLNANVPNFPSRWSPGSFLYHGLQMVPDMAVAMGGTALGGPEVGVGAMGLSVLPNFYAQERHQGHSHAGSLGIAGLQSLAEVVPEAPFLTHASQAARGATFMERMARRATGGVHEAKSEIGTEIADKIIDHATGDSNQTLGQDIADVGFAGALGFLPGFTLAGSGPSAREQLIEALAKAKNADDLSQIITPEAASAWNAPPPAAPQAEAAPETNITPEVTAPPDTMPAPGRTGSPAPESAAGKASAPIPAATQETATTPEPPPSPPATTESVVPPATPAPEIPEPGSAPQATPVSTAQETQAGGTAVQPPAAPLTTPPPAPPAPTTQAEKPALSPLPKIGKGQKAKVLAADHQERVNQNVDTLRGMAHVAGWGERGGRLMRDPNHPEDDQEHAPVIGRTKWLAKSPWFREVIKLPNNEHGDATRAAVEKAIAGQKLSPTEAAHVSQMLDWADAETAKAQAEKIDDFDPFDAGQAVAETETKDNQGASVIDAALQRQAQELDPDAEERAAIQHPDDDVAYMQAIRDIITRHGQGATHQGSGETVRGAARQEESVASAAGEKPAGDFQLTQPAAPAAKEVKPAASQGELLPKNQTQQDLADRERQKDEARSPNKDVPADVGGGLFAKQQSDITDAAKEEPTAEEPPADEQMTELGDFAPEDTGDYGDEGPTREEMSLENRGTLASSMPGKTGTQPRQPLPGEETPTDPLRQVAGERAAAIEAKMEADQTPDVAPDRDQNLTASRSEKLWRDLYRKQSDNETDADYKKAQDDFVQKMNGAPIQQQIRWATERLTHYYEFKGIELDPALQTREKMDALLDLYHNLERQAQVMGQPKEAMGFNGDLTLRISKSLGNQGTRGEFTWDFSQGPGASKLSLARRADSFTHEWLHMLDLNLLMRYTKRMAVGISGAMNETRTKLKELPKDIHDAFQDVMRHILLTDQASVAKMGQLTLEAENTQQLLEKARSNLRYTEGITNKEAEREAQAKKYDAEADALRAKGDNFRAGSAERAAKQLREGNAKAKTALPARKAEFERLQKKLKALGAEVEKLLHDKASALVQGSKFADFMQGREYFGIPAELFARAGEVWMANRIGQQSGAEGLVSSPEFYDGRDSDLLRLVYPNPADRVRIFQAFDHLFSTLAKNQYFEGNTAAAQMPQPTSIEKELAVESKQNKKVNAIALVWKAAVADVKALGKMLMALRNPNKFLPEAKADFIRSIGYFKEFLYGFYSSRGRMLGLEAKAKALGKTKLAQHIRTVLLKLTNDPGSGTVQTEGVEQESHRRTVANINHLKRIEEMHGLDVNNEEQMSQLYQELVKPTEEVRQELNDYMEFLDEKLRSIEGDKNKTDQLRRLRGQRAAVEKQLAEIDKPSQAPQNIRDAATAIRDLMNKEYYYNQDAGIDLGYKSNYMFRIYDDDVINASPESRAHFVESATELYEFEKGRKLRAMNRQLATLESQYQIQKSISRNLDRGREAMKELGTKMNELRAKMAEVQAEKSEDKAKQWLYKSQVGDMFQFDRSSPASVYTNERVFGPYADIVMKPFMDQNPISILHQYLPMSARRAAYAKRFGANHEQYQLLREKMIREGIDLNDLQVIDEQVKYVTGTYDPGIAKGLRSAVNAMYNMLTMAILPASLFVNLFEPITNSLRTGRVRDGFVNMWNTMGQVMGTGDAAQMRQIADVIGIMARSGHDSILQNRYSLDAGVSKSKTQKVTEHFYRTTGMHAYTNASRIATMKFGGRYLNTWADVLLDPNSSAKAKAAAAEEFREMGVPDRLHQRFANFVKSQGNMISINELADPNNATLKNHYITALHSYVDSVIGNPKAADRAIFAHNPIGKFVMSISAFNYYFQRHILARFGKRFQRAEGLAGKASVAMQFAMPFLSLMIAQMAARMMREFFMDRDKFERRAQKIGDEPIQSFFDAIDAAGGTGGFSPVYNAFFKSRYSRDFSSIAMGAAPGFLLDNLQSIYNGIVDEKDPNNTSNSAERAAMSSGYRMGMNMMLPRLLYGIGARGPLAWLALTQLTSYSTANSFAEMTQPKTANERAAEAGRLRRENRTPSEERKAERRRERRQRNIERRYGQ